MNKRVGVDFDGVILPFGPLTDDNVPPYEGVALALDTLKKKGFEIIIHTSRLSPTWWIDDYKYFGANDPLGFGEAQMEYVKSYLKRWAIPYDILTAEKIPCAVYFDDRAIRISEDYPLYGAVEEWLHKK